MGLFRGEKSSSKARLNAAENGARLPRVIGAKCLGDACPNFTGAPCRAPDKRLTTAISTAESKPSETPRATDTEHAIYAQICFRGKEPVIVAKTAYIYSERLERDGAMDIVREDAEYGGRLTVEFLADGELPGHELGDS